MRSIDGILFDLDGTLIDSEPIHIQAWNSILEQHGHTPPPKWNADCIGLPDSHARDKACRMFPDLTSAGDLLGQKQARLRELVVKQGPSLVFPGVMEKLNELRDAGIPMAVGTNSIMRNTKACLEATGILEYFPVVVTMDLVPNGKPAPDIYLTAAAKLGLAPGRCAVIEDSPAGIQSGKAAGCLVLGLLTSWTAEVIAGADRIFADTPSAIAWALSDKAGHA